MKFEPSEDITEIAKAYALDAVDFAKIHFNIKLDFSDSSIKDIENILANLHERLKIDKPKEEDIYRVAKIFGSYLGEVYIKNHGGQWGIINSGNKDNYVGILANNGSLFWSWGRAYNRLINGSEDNINHYYFSITRQ
jgi:hypothetical protein